MGFASRTYNYDGLRLFTIPRKIHLLCFSEHHPVAIRLLDRLRLPLVLDAKRSILTFHFPHPLDPATSHPRGDNFLTRLAFWVRFFSSHRLHHLHTCEIMQATSCHVPASYNFSKIIPFV